MPLPNWDEVRAALADAIRAALPLQVRAAGGGRIAGVGLHFDAYYGSAGLYLLPEAAAALAMPPEVAANIGDWPISTDRDATADHAEAFDEHWGTWDDWSRDHVDALTDAEQEEQWARLPRVACEAMRQVDRDGLLAAFPRTPDFRVIIAEHDEPDELVVGRYDLFLRTGTIRQFGIDT